MKSRNYIYLKGGIVKMRASKTVASICIATDGGGNTTSFPTIVFFNPQNMDGLKIGDRVTIEAHMQLRPIRNEDKEIIDYEQSYIGDSICKTPRLLAAYMEDEQADMYDGGVQEDANYALVFGKVRHVFSPNENLTLLSVRVPNEKNHHMDTCEIVCFRKQSDVAKMLAAGDCVMIYGSIRTRNGKKENAGSENRTVQNVVCKDILKVNGFEDIE